MVRTERRPQMCQGTGQVLRLRMCEDGGMHVPVLIGPVDWELALHQHLQKLAAPWANTRGTQSVYVNVIHTYVRCLHALTRPRTCDSRRLHPCLPVLILIIEKPQIRNASIAELQNHDLRALDP